MNPMKSSLKSGEGITGILTGLAMYLAPLLGMTPEQIENLKGFAPEIVILVVAFLGIRTAYKAWHDHKTAQIEIAKIQAGQAAGTP